MRPLEPAPRLNQRPPPRIEHTSTSTAASISASTRPTAACASASSRCISRSTSATLCSSRLRAASRMASVGESFASLIPLVFGTPPLGSEARIAAKLRGMRFQVAQKTLESLEWPQIASRLRAACRTPQARERVPRHREEAIDPLVVEPVDPGAAEFATSLGEVRERLAETSEARVLLDAGHIPPLGGVHDLEATFRRAGKGGTTSPQQLLEVRQAILALHETARFLSGRADEAPRLAVLADVLSDHRALERAIDRAIDSGGEVRDEASPELAAARRERNQLAGDLQRRLARYLRDPDVLPSLSDAFYTVRNDRYVLPVRADARGAVRGIVHDASRSGTTIFIEPEAVVDLNNRLKHSELTAQREVERVLQALGVRLAEDVPALRADLEMLASLDLAFARGRLSQEMDASEPQVEADGVFHLPQLRHPLLDPAEAVPNDMHLGDDWHVLVISGPNAGGKTVALKAFGLAALFVRAGLHVPAHPGSRVALVDEVLADIGDGQDMREYRRLSRRSPQGE